MIQVTLHDTSLHCPLWDSESDKTSNKHLLIIVVVQQLWASLVAQMVKNLPAMWETWVQSLSWEDSLEEGMATHS